MESVEGAPGDFTVTLVNYPRFIDPDVCTGCGQCAQACPITGVNEYDCGLGKRAAISIRYAQAIPLAYSIDRDICIGCGLCEKVCLAEAVRYDDRPRKTELRVGALVLTPGSKVFDPKDLDTLCCRESPNVVTSMEFERILSASGPYLGHLMRPYDREEPAKIAWLQCVGSRDIHRCDHGYCSSVCCMYAIKEAVIAKEHARGDLDCAIFFMDMRTYGKDFERYYEDARNKHKIRFIRSRVHTVDEIRDTGDLLIQYATEDGRLKAETFDMVVLSVGFETPRELIDLSRTLQLQLTEGNFCQTSSFAPVSTSREGIFVGGAFQNPKDIPQSVIDASAAACAVGEILSPSRHTLTKAKEKIPELPVVGERPRIGVFVCKCGINIAGVVDVDAVREYAAGLPYVVYAADNLYTCSQDTQDAISRVIKENHLNRVVVAACTPKTHEPLFQETLAAAGLNKYLFEMTNIRNQDSWVHRDSPELATEKAKDLVRMAVAKVALMEPLQESTLSIDQNVLVVGGGVAGLMCARTLSRQGYEVFLIERSNVLGGQALDLYQTWKGEDIQDQVCKLIDDVERDVRIHVYLSTELTSVEGFVGNFKTQVKTGDGRTSQIEHGVAILATGAQEYRPEEYLYGRDPRVMTHLELDRRFMAGDPALKEIQSAVFIQCVGSREPERPYCSRVCCTHSMESALHLKELNPDMDVVILYRDIRTYGEREYLYRAAREAGVRFFRFSLDRKPRVRAGENRLEIEVMDTILGRPIVMEADLLTLAAAIVPYRDQKLAQFFKVPMNEDGFFVEAHAKLGPSEFATDGVFLCGMAHYPKSIDESAAQALAASSRAVTLLARKDFQVSGTVAEVNPLYCSGCGVCVEICPYSAPSFVSEGRFAGKAQINPVLCKGCGLCVASCRSGALNLKGFGEDQIIAMINEM